MAAGNCTYIYLDESGDLGFDFKNKHPSKYFTITILVTADFSIIKSAVKKTLKNKVNYKNKKRIVCELKGSATNIEVKNYFYNKIAKDDNWFLSTVILDKQNLIKNKHVPTKERLYNQISKAVLEDIDMLRNASIVQLYIDRSKSLKEIRIFDMYIKSHLEINLQANAKLYIEHINSEKNIGLQAVDMFCYGISRKYEIGDDTWYDLFKHRIKREIIYRP